MGSRITVKAPPDQLHWSIVAGNGEILAHSEEYSTRWSRDRAAKRLSKLTGWPIDAGYRSTFPRP